MIETEHRANSGVGTVLDHRNYTWDEMFNKESRSDALTGVGHAYQYDDAYRLAQTTVQDATPPTLLRDTTYNHDGVHNRTSVVGNPDTGPHVGVYDIDPATPEPADRQMNQYSATPVHPDSPLSSGERSYDLNGNLVQIGADCDCIPYGDVAPHPSGNGIVDLDDVLCVLDGFASEPACPNGDIYPCEGNGNIDLDDVIAILDAFAGDPACLDACGHHGPPCPGNVVRIAYDYRNRMVEWHDLGSDRRHTYSYDAFGRRIKKVVDVDGASRGLQPARSGDARGSAGPIETRYFYGGPSQWQVIEEQNAGGNTVATYVYGNYIDDLIHMRRCVDEPAACTPNSSQISYYFHADENFNVMAVTGSTGTVVERYEYDDYGRPQFFDGSGTLSLQESAIGNPYLFTGREYDAETGLYHYRTRYLDPVAGRFTTRDVIGLWGDEAELGNGYSYVGNNPWSLLDPFGLGDVRNSGTMGTAMALATARSALASALAAFGRNPNLANMQRVQQALQNYVNALENALVPKKIVKAMYDRFTRLINEIMEAAGQGRKPPRLPQIPDMKRWEIDPVLPQELPKIEPKPPGKKPQPPKEPGSAEHDRNKQPKNWDKHTNPRSGGPEKGDERRPYRRCD